MKCSKIFLGSCFIIVLMGFISLAWSRPDPPSLSIAPKESFFLKAGAGSFIDEWYFNTFNNRPLINGISNQFNMTLPGLTELNGSISVGVDFPDGFSVFLSGEGFSRDSGIILNAQKCFSISSWLQFYFFGGLGLDGNENGSIGGAGQFGLGSFFPMGDHLSLFTETEFYVAYGEWSSPSIPAYNYTWWDLHWPISVGVKYNL